MTVFALIGWVGFFLALIGWWRSTTWWAAQCKRWTVFCDEQAAAWKLTCERLIRERYPDARPEAPRC